MMASPIQFADRISRRLIFSDCKKFDFKAAAFLFPVNLSWNKFRAETQNPASLQHIIKIKKLRQIEAR